MDDFEHEASRDDSKVEITHLYPHREVPRSSAARRMLHTPLFWWLVTTGSVLLLALLVLLGSFPSVRNQALNFFTRLAPGSGERLTSSAIHVGSYADSVYAL